MPHTNRQRDPRLIAEPVTLPPSRGDNGYHSAAPTRDSGSGTRSAPDPRLLRLVNRLRQTPEQRAEVEALVADPLQPALDMLRPWRQQQQQPKPSAQPKPASKGHSVAGLIARGAFSTPGTPLYNPVAASLSVPVADAVREEVVGAGQEFLNATKRGASRIAGGTIGASAGAYRALKPVAGVLGPAFGDPGGQSVRGLETMAQGAEIVANRWMSGDKASPAPTELPPDASLVKRGVYKAANLVGESAPAMALGGLAAVGTGGASMLGALGASAATLGVTDAGARYAETQGKSEGQRALEATLTGVVSTVFNVIPINRIFGPRVAKMVGDSIARTATKIIAREGGEAVAGGGANAIQQVAQRLVDEFAGGQEGATDLDRLSPEMVDAFFGGALLTSGARAVTGQMRPVDAPKVSTVDSADTSTRVPAPENADTQAGVRTVRTAQDPNGTPAAQGKSREVVDNTTSTSPEPTIAEIDTEIASAINERRIPADPGNPRAEAAVTAARIIREAGGPSNLKPNTVAGLRAAVAQVHGLSDPVAAKVVERTRRALARQEGEQNVRREMEAQDVTDADVPPVDAVDLPRVPERTPAGRVVEADLSTPVKTPQIDSSSSNEAVVRKGGRGEFGERLNIPPVADRYFGEYATPDEAKAEGFTPDTEIAEFGTLTREDAVLLAREAAKEKPGQYAVVPGPEPTGYPAQPRPYTVVSRKPDAPAPKAKPPASEQPPATKEVADGAPPNRRSDPAQERPVARREDVAPPARPLDAGVPKVVGDKGEPTRAKPRDVAPRVTPAPERATFSGEVSKRAPIDRAGFQQQLRAAFGRDLSPEQLADVETVTDAVVNASAKRRGVTPDQEYARLFAGVEGGELARRIVTDSGLRQRDPDQRAFDFGMGTDSTGGQQRLLPRDRAAAPKTPDADPGPVLNADQPRRENETDAEYRIRRQSREAELATGRLFQARDAGIQDQLERARTRLKDRGPVEIVSVRGDELLPMGATLEALQKRVRAWATDKTRLRSVTNADQGVSIRIGTNGIKKTISHGASRDHVLSIPAIPEMLRRAVKLWDQKPKTNEPIAHYFAAPVRIEDRTFRALLVVKEDGSGHLFYDHDLTRLEPTDAPPPEALEAKPRATGGKGDQVGTMSIADLLAQGKRKSEGLSDRAPDRALAAVGFGRDGRALMLALTDPNVSSPLHELAHVAAISILDGPDLRAAAMYVGAKPDVPAVRWTVAQHEKFARAFEKYLYDGKAPSAELRGVFERLAAWMRDIYKSIKGTSLDQRLTPEIREVFDRLLGGDGGLARIDGASGRRGELALAGGKVLPVEYRIVDIGKLEPTHIPEDGFAPNPRGDKNERPYQDPTEGEQLRTRVREMAKEPRPGLLLTDTPSATDGPPIINEKGQVLGGNARTMAMRLAFGEDKAAADTLRSAVREAARRFDIDPETIAGIENPVLVRVVPDEFAGEPGELSRALNEALTAARSPDADAVSRGAKLDEAAVENVLAAVGDGSLAEALSDPTRSRRLLKSLVESGAFNEKDIDALTSQGRLTDEGKATVKRTLMGAAVRDVRTLAAMPASVENVIAKALPSVVRLTRTPNTMDFERVLSDALDGMGELSRSGMSLDDLIDQATFTPEPWRSNRAAISLMRALDTETPTTLARKFKVLAEAAKDEAAGQGGVFGNAPSVADAFADQFDGGFKSYTQRASDMDDPIIDTYVEMRDRQYGKQPRRVPETFAEAKPRKPKPAPLFEEPRRPAAGTKPKAVPDVPDTRAARATEAILESGIVSSLRDSVFTAGRKLRDATTGLRRADGAVRVFAEQMSDKASAKREESGRVIAEARRQREKAAAMPEGVQRDRVIELAEGAEARAFRLRQDADAADQAAQRTRKMSEKLGKFVQTTKQLEGESLKRLDAIARKHNLSKADWRAITLAGLEGDRSMLPEKLHPAFDDLRDLMDNGPGQMNDAAAVNVMRKLPGGGYLKLKGNGAFVPQVLNAQGRRIAKELASGDIETPRFRALVDSMVLDGKFPTTEAAELALRSTLESRLNGSNNYFEKTRTLLPEELIETDLYSVLRHTIGRNARTVAAGRVFGHYIDNAVTGIDITVGDITKHTGPSAGKAFEEFISIELGKPPTDRPLARAISRGVIRAQSVTKLSGLFSAIKNLGQPLTAASDYGFLPVAKAYFADYPILLGELDSLGRMIPQRTALGRKARSLIERVTPGAVKRASDAAVAAGVPGQLQDVTDLADFKAGLPSVVDRVSDAAMLGFATAERSNAVRAAAAARNAMNSHLAAIMAMEGPNGRIRRIVEMVAGLDVNPRASARRRLERLGITDKAFDEALKRGSFTPEEIEGAMYRLATDTQFAMTTATKPMWYERMPWLRVPYQFKNFSIRMTGLLYDRAIKEGLRGNFGPMVRMTVGTLAFMELYRALRGYVTGEEDRTIAEALMRPDDADRVSATAKQGIRHMLEGGMFGVLGDFERGAWEYLAGPTGSTLMSAVDAASNINERPTLDQVGMAAGRFVREQVSGANQWASIANRLTETNRRAIASREIRRRAYGWKDSQSERGVVQGLADDALKGLRGFERWDNSPGTLVYRYAADAINADNPDAAAEYIASLLRSTPRGEKRQRIITGVKNAMNRKSPLGPVQRKDREAFLRTLTPAQREKVIELQDRFMRDSARALDKALRAVRTLESQTTPE